MKLLLVCATLVAVHGVCRGFTRDTLANYDPRSTSAFYRDTRITAQAARFDLAAPAYVRQVSLMLGGRGTGRVVVRLYGNEGAFPAPLLSLPLTEPIELRKTSGTVQRIELVLPPDLFIDRPQFFVVVEHLDPDIRLLSDRTPKERICRTPTEAWGYQAIRSEDGSWRAGRYGFAVSTVVDYPQEMPPSYLAVVTDDAGIVAEKSTSRSIAWGDIDRDGWLDLLGGGRLYLNRSGKEFADVSDRIDDLQTALATHLLDVDDDRDLDILLLGGPDGSSRLLLNDGSGYFTGRPLALPRLSHPRTVAIADIDDDNDLDLFVGQGSASTGESLPGYLLLGSGHGAFSVALNTPRLDSTLLAGVIGAQWIDRDGDGDVDLSITRVTADENDLLLNDGSGQFTSHSTASLVPAATIADAPSAPQSGRSGTGDWADYDGDGTADQLLPISLRANDLGYGIGEGAFDEIIGLPYEGWGGGGTWSDVNNDGLLDALVTSLCDCRYSSLYTQMPGARFSDESFAYGLFRVPAGTDAVWADYDNDGRLDMATFVGDRLHLFHNTGQYDNNFVTLDLSGSPNASDMIGASVTLHAGADIRTLTLASGRGALMQGPPRAHFGLGAVTMIDSIVVRPAGNGSPALVLQRPAINRIHYLFADDRAAITIPRSASVTTAPNPFDETLTFTLTIPEKSHVRLTIHALDGTVLAVAADEQLDAGERSIAWTARDAEGKRLAPGTYIWRAVIGSTQLTGRALLVR